MELRSSSRFQQLPGELLTSIFGRVRPKEIRALALTCRTFRNAIAGNKMLFKAVYLQAQDKPPKDMQVGWDWERELKEISKLGRLLTNPTTSRNVKEDNVQFVAERVVSMARSANPDSAKSLNIHLLRTYFDQKIPGHPNIEIFGCQSSLFERARLPLREHSDIEYRSFEDRQASAKLHVYHGAPIWKPDRKSFVDVYPFAISKVYDLRNYTPLTLWGPFRPDGKATVDWEKMEAAMVVLGHNMKDFAFQSTGVLQPLWNHNWDGFTPGSFVNRPFPRPLEISDLGWKDPYNITGSYLRVVCFLDFHELFRYNFVGPPLPPDQPREPKRTVEAVRLIMMELQATQIEKPGPDDGQDLPVVHFTGVSRSMHSSWDPNANANIRGTVRKTKEGEIRWTTVSVYQGEERWQSECIQVGGLNTGRGVLGHWFDKDWHVHGPAGPTVFWKISNDIDDKSKKRKSSRSLSESSEDEDYEDDGYVEVEVVGEEEEEEEESEEEGDEVIEGAGGGVVIIVHDHAHAHEYDHQPEHNFDHEHDHEYSE